jgi:DNA-binding response OmpR family regulator
VPLPPPKPRLASPRVAARARPASPYVLVIGHESEVEREDGASQVLVDLGAEVATLGLWSAPAEVLDEREGVPVRAVLVEAGDRPDLAQVALRAARRDSRLEGVPSIIAISERQVAQLDPSIGFDDFVLCPYVPAELYARIRALEWRMSEFATEERTKLGALIIDKAAHEVTVEGRKVILTAKEFALLAYLSANRGRVCSRETLLSRVWGRDYEGGPRTVDIHVRRLRAKLGAALPLETLRGTGYKIAGA